MTYPFSPGGVARDTSAAAIDRQAAATLRERCLASLRQHGPQTADEVALRVRASVLAVRPRFSELAALGEIEDNGDRRPNTSGRLAIVWRVAPPPLGLPRFITRGAPGVSTVGECLQCA